MMKQEIGKSTDDIKAEDAFVAATTEIIWTMHDLRKSRKMFPTLVLLYASIDVFGSLVRPKSNPDTSGEYFRKWVDLYLLGGHNLPTSSEDLWGARCGLLHTHTASSQNSRKGNARELHYYIGNGDKDLAKYMQAEFQKNNQSKIPLDLDMLFDAFIDGLMRFAKDVQTDAALKDTVFHHTKSWCFQSSFKLEKPHE